jgi:hypothetical protein
MIGYPPICPGRKRRSRLRDGADDPILVWAFIGSFVFFDAYRVYNTSVKTTYMVPTCSRGRPTWSTHDIQGMANVANTIIRGSDEIEMRVTQIGMVSGDYNVDWSWRERRRAAVQFQPPAIRDRFRSCRTASASSWWKPASSTKRPSMSA